MFSEYRQHFESGQQRKKATTLYLLTHRVPYICCHSAATFSLKTASCQRQFSSYRSTFALPRGEWTKVQIPWAKFDGYGWGAVENNFDPSSLRRIGIVSIGKEVEVTLALSSVGFYKD